MDEAADNGAVEFSDSEETPVEERRFLFEEVLDQADVCDPGNCEIRCIINVVTVSLIGQKYTAYIGDVI